MVQAGEGWGAGIPPKEQRNFLAMVILKDQPKWAASWMTSHVSNNGAWAVHEDPGHLL